MRKLGKLCRKEDVEHGFHQDNENFYSMFDEAVSSCFLLSDFLKKKKD